jgi:WD40 repeat protein
VTRPSPFKGLASFDESDADARLFFGREREREIIVANLLASRLTVLYGDTGVGKSSVLRAGVARDLRALPDPLAVVVFDDWQDDPAGALERRVSEVTGADPQGRLVDTLELGAGLVGGEVVVILDGVEEEFLYHGADAGPGSFLAEFSEAATRPGLRASFLLAIREDALAKLDRFKSRVPNVFGNYLRLNHLDRDEAREAIQGPVDRYNESAADGTIEIEPALVEAVLDQVVAGKVELGQSGRGGVDENGSQLGIEAPFLQLVMQRLWETEAAAGSDVLRYETLERLGGAGQIVRDHLDRALAALEPAQRDVAAAVFNHLVTPSGTKIAHDASDLAGYVGVAPSEVEPVLSALAAERILRSVPGVPGSDLPRYEIYHDILAGAVLDWRTRHESEREVDRVREAAHKRHRRLLLVAAGAVVLAGAMAGLTIFAFTKQSDADAEATKARARAFEESALFQLPHDPELSLVLAAEAARLNPGFRAEEVLRQVLLAARELAVFRTGGEITFARFIPGRRRFVIAGLDGVARVYDARRRVVLFRLPQHAPIESGDIDQAGNVIATGDESGNIKVWRASDGHLLGTFSCGSRVRSVALDAAGRRVVSACGQAVVLWSLVGKTTRWRHDLGWQATHAIFSPDQGPFADSVAVIGNHSSVVLLAGADGAERKSFDQGDTSVKSVAFSLGGSYLAAGGTTKSNVHVWNLRAGTSTELPNTPAVPGLAFTPNGAALATASLDGTARTWIVKTAARRAPLTGHTNGVISVSFSRDAKLVLTASRDHTARIWTNTDSPDMVAVLSGHRGAVTQASFGPNAEEALTGSSDHTARLWDASQPELRVKARLPGSIAAARYAGADVAVAGPGPSVHLVRASDWRPLWKLKLRKDVTAAKVAPNGKLLAAAAGRFVYLFSLPGRRQLGKLAQSAVVTAIDFSPDSTRLATGGTDHSARIWTLFHSGSVELTGHRKKVTDVAFSPDGKLLATSSDDDTARLWDARTGGFLRTLSGHQKPVLSVAFSPDSKQAVTAGADHDARVWDVATGDSVFQLHWHTGIVRDAEFSPDGRWIATIGPQSGQLWRVGSDQPLFPLLGIVQRGTGKSFVQLTSVAFDPKSHTVLASADDGALRTYECNVCGGIHDLLHRADAQLALTGRTLTKAERKKYGG